MRTEASDGPVCPVMDFHSHILPRMDDGSASAEMTLAMLDIMAAQGIGRVVATPHFYPMREDINRFLKRRERAVRELLDVHDPARHPAVALGAEVAYYHGISDASSLDRLCLSGTRLLLLEMPFCRWPAETAREVASIEKKTGIKPVLAHIERYIYRQRQPTLGILRESGALFQTNASFFLDRRTRSRAMRMLEAGQIHFLGSDSHNTNLRAPNLGSAIDVLSAHGADLESVIEAEKEYLETVSVITDGQKK